MIDHLDGTIRRSLNQEAVDGIRHTIAGCLANLSVQDDEVRRLFLGLLCTPASPFFLPHLWSPLHSLSFYLEFARVERESER
jgi:hypothetical protein